MPGNAEFDAALAAMVLRVEAEAARVATEAAHLIEAAAKQRAPVRTGTLRRSITSRSGFGREVGDVGYSVAPTVVYARRIELGFEGPDSLGRIYHQQGNPYLKPAVHESIAPITGLFQRRMVAAIRG